MVLNIIKFILEYVPKPIAMINNYIKTALEHVIKLKEYKQQSNPTTSNNLSATSALSQVFKLLYNYPQETSKKIADKGNQKKHPQDYK